MCYHQMARWWLGDPNDFKTLVRVLMPGVTSLIRKSSTKLPRVDWVGVQAVIAKNDAIIANKNVFCFFMLAL